MGKYGRLLRPLLIIIRRIRGLRFPEVNRELSLFLVFLIMSIVFWFFQVCMEETRYEINYSLNITNIPKNVIITSDVPDSVKVTVEDYGFKILEYFFASNDTYRLNIDFPKMTNSSSWKLSGGGVFTVDISNMRRMVNKTLKSSSKLLSVNLSSLDVYYSTGESKRVPVLFNGSVKAASQHVIQGMTLQPDSVDIFSTYSQLDTLQAVYTEYTPLKNLEESLHTQVKMQQMTGVKIVPGSVTMDVSVDLITEKKISVPILAENTPENLVLRAFPVRCEVTFQVSATDFDNVKEEDFLIVVDYNTVKEGGDRYPIRLVSYPDNVLNVRVSPKTCECIVEELTN